MNFLEIFIRRPVATTLLMIGITLSGAAAFRLLPVSPLPQVDFPTISVSAQLPGASPETMAASVATPLERQFGRIAGVSEMTSASSLGSTAITLQFDLNRGIDAAAQDVQAAINAARGYLPANLPNNPTYRKVNPADSPIMILALTSKTLSKGQMYDAASTVMAQRLSQVDGVGQVTVGGSSLPAVRIELNPHALNKYGIGFEQVRAALSSTNTNLPKGQVEGLAEHWQIGANDQLLEAIDYQPLIIAYRNGSAVRLRDVGEAQDSIEDIRTAGYANGVPAILVVIFREPGANIISTVDAIGAVLPQLKASISKAININVAMDQTVTIRASVHDVERTLLISIGLVIVVVFAFLRSARTALIPSVAVPLSLIGTFGVMYLLGYSLDNLSLMALTISTGFVVDDAIVVIENITRYIEQGVAPFQAATKGLREIASTVFTISVSLSAVFIPLLMMGGIVGRLFREFAVTMAVAILISMVISLTATPMMCAHLLKQDQRHGRLYWLSERAFRWMIDVYGRTLNVALRFSAITLTTLIITIAVSAYLFLRISTGFFPQQDNGRINGSIQADQDTAFETMDHILRHMIDLVKADPGVESVLGFTGGGGPSTTSNTGRLFISLKPLDVRHASADEIINRLRPKLAEVPGATLFLQATQDVRVGGRTSPAQYQFTIQGDNLADLTGYAPRVLEQLKKTSSIVDVNSDQQNRGLQSMLQYDRDAAGRVGISSQLIDNTLYEAFGQDPVSTMYTAMNQYHVVMEAAPQFWQSPEALKTVFVHSPSGVVVPLAAVARWAPATAPLVVNHQGLFPAVTISFNLRPGVALGEAVSAIDAATDRLGLPPSLHRSFTGTAEAYKQSLANQPLLIATALAVVYIVLGMLYESYIHPITILSTLPSAGVGALLALLLTHTDLTIMAMIGIILLIGIVKKNAIMMVDFAVAAERNENKNSRDSIFEACLLRFRPILMTTMAAVLGALPLALGNGVGHELRQPLGITIIGGLIVSQLLTLYTTPVVYLYFDRLQVWWRSRRGQVPRDLLKPVTHLLFLAAVIILGGCAVGPKYIRPSAPVPPVFKEDVPETWKEAEPNAEFPRGKWWEIYEDPQLNALVEQVSISNQNVLAAMAQYLEARDQVRIARSGRFPTVSASPAITNSRNSSTITTTNTLNFVSGPRTEYSMPVDVSYQTDVWGNIGRSVTGAAALAQASAADLENARLAYQAAMAQYYFELHSLDTEANLLETTVAAYEQYLQLTKDRMQAGIASGLDVAQAETQLETTRAQLIDLGVLRAQFEHAIAILIGKPPADLSIPGAVLKSPPPPLPAGVPSALLERRPDIAAAERRVAAANEQIGIAKSAFFPSIILGVSGGFGSTNPAQWFSWPSRMWSFGPQFAAALFDGGKRKAQVDLESAAYDATVANYRQTVLTAFQQVEDQLAALRILEQETQRQDQAVQAAQRSLDIATEQYKAGTADYLTVITVQTAALQNQRTAVDLLNRRLTASVLLIEALGGGWDASELQKQ